MEFRQIDILGEKAIIWGYERDPYFNGLVNYKGANDFLFTAVATLPLNATIIDVGANIGLTAAIFKIIHPTSRVICFEPDPVAYPALLETIEANKLDGVQVHHTALGATNGRLTFTQNSDSASASHLAPDSSMMEGGISVDVIRLDDFADTEIKRLDFIKIDVEGFEPDVLDGARRTIAEYRPSVFLEFNSFALIAFRNSNPRTLLESLFNTFPYVYAHGEAGPYQLKSNGDRLAFIHDNIVRHGGVDDLFCTWEPIASPAA